MRNVLVFLMSLGLAGCSADLLASTAVQGELQAKQLQAVQGEVGRVADSTGKINLQRAVETYNAEKGHNPKSLQDLVPGWLPSIPKHADGTPYGYDPTTGRVLDAPSKPTLTVATVMSDERKMAKIRMAINKYGEAVKYYPPSLQALVPTYLPSVPKASNGQDFIYYPQNGALINPARPHPQSNLGQQRPMVRRGGVGGGAGPMGEVTTGINMSNQLDSMSNAGATAVGGYARRSLGRSVQMHNQQEEQALRQLGD